MPISEKFKLIYNQYASVLRRVAIRLCEDGVLADDLTQETWLRVYKKMDTIDEVDNMQAWIMTILRNEFYRVCSRKMKISDNSIEQLKTLPDPGKVEDYTLLSQTIDSLNDQNHPIILEVIYGLSQKSIAEKLGISEGASRLRKCRERKRLKTGMNEGVYGFAA